MSANVNTCPEYWDPEMIPTLPIAFEAEHGRLNKKIIILCCIKIGNVFLVIYSGTDENLLCPRMSSRA